MTRRFWIGAALAVPIVILEMGAHFPALNLHHFVSPQTSVWIQFVLGSPVVLWAGWPLLERGWASFRNRSLNMFSLIALGVGAAYLYSLAATFAPGLFPAGLRQKRDRPGLLRGGRRHHGARAARAGAGAARARDNRQRHSRTAEPRAEDRAMRIRADGRTRKSR